VASHRGRGRSRRRRGGLPASPVTSGELRGAIGATDGADGPASATGAAPALFRGSNPRTSVAAPHPSPLARRSPLFLTGLSLTRQFAVRPAAVSYTGDNSGFLGGFDGSPRWDSSLGAQTHLGHFSWSTWNRRQATGTGAVWARTCWRRKPCAHRFTAFPATARAFAPFDGHFTRLTVASRGIIDCRGVQPIPKTSFSPVYYDYFIVRCP
jgi:hypothetical protein